MAILFDEKEFEDFIISKGIEYGEPVVAEVELEAFKNGGQLEYLFYVYNFCKVLKDNNILSFVRYDDYPSFIMEILGMDDSDHIINEMQNIKYIHNRNNRFDVYIPSGKNMQAINLFSEITSYSTRIRNPYRIFFGENEKYQIGLIQNEYLNVLSKINEDILNNIQFNDIRIINYMLQFNDKDYHMFNISERMKAQLNSWYSLINIAKPKSIGDLVKIYALLKGNFNNRKLLVQHIEKYGLDNIICCRDQLYTVLCDQYHISKEKVDTIWYNQMSLHHLTKSDELLLESYKVPKHIVSQLNNMRCLVQAIHAVINVELICKLNYIIKIYYNDNFIDSSSSS